MPSTAISGKEIAMRLMTASAAVLLVLALAACGSDDSDEESTPDPEASPAAPVQGGDSDAAPTDAATSASEATAQAAPLGPCDLVPSADVEAAFGKPLDGGTDRFGGHSENNVEYSSVDCTWEAEDQLEVELELSYADDFEQGLVCQPVSYLGDEGKPVEVAGASSATWLASVDPNEIEARLRACTDAVVITINVEDETGASVPELRTASIEVAEQALAAL